MVAKSSKNVAVENRKQPRAKRKSDEIYNARRRAKRAQQRLQKQIESGTLQGNELKAVRNLNNSLNETIKKSYAKRTKEGIKYSENIKQVTTSLNAAKSIVDEGVKTYAPKRLTKETELSQNVIPQSEVMRKNEIWKRNISQATLKEGVSPLGEQETRTFFRVTQRFWNVEGVSMQNRLDAIVKGLGVRTIEEAYELVINNKYVQEYLQKMEDEEDGSTDEIMERYRYVERMINKIDALFSLSGNPFTYENLVENES